MASDDWVSALNALEQRLLRAWVSGPSFRAKWTPNPTDFYAYQTQAVARACAALHQLGVKAWENGDLGVALVEQLTQTGELRRYWDLGAPVLCLGPIRDPEGDLVRWRDLRCLFALRQRLQELVSGLTPGGDLEEAREAVLVALECAHTAGPAPSYTDLQLMQLAWHSMTRKDRMGSFSGHVELDQLTGGIRPGHVWVLGAPTNWGKSSFLLSIADHYLSIHERGVLFVTCEDAPELLATRLMCRRASIPGKAARDARVHPRDLDGAVEQLKIAESRGGKPVMIDGRGRPVESLVEDIRGAVATHGVQVVLVDYLQCISTKRDTQDRRGEINHISRLLTDAIKTSGAGGVIASQLTGENIRESQDVEHAAEVVLIGRKHEDTGKLSLFVKKNKTGPSGAELALTWDAIPGAFRTKVDDENTDSRHAG